MDAGFYIRRCRLLAQVRWLRGLLLNPVSELSIEPNTRPTFVCLATTLAAPHHTETTDAALTNSQALNGIYFGALLDVYWVILALLHVPYKAPS